MDISRIPDSPSYPVFGLGRDARESDLKAGEQMVRDIVSWLGRKKQELLDDYDPDRPSLLRTFDDVEAFWENWPGCDRRLTMPKRSGGRSLREQE